MADIRSGVADEITHFVDMAADAKRLIVVLVIECAVQPGAPGLHTGGGGVVRTGIQPGDVFPFSGGQVIVVVLPRIALTVGVLKVRGGEKLVGGETGLVVDSEGGVLGVGGFCRDDDGAVGGLGTVQGGGRSTFQDRNAFDVVRINISRTVSVVDGERAALAAGIRGGCRIVHGNTVNDEQGGIVLQVGRRLSADGYTHGTVRTAAAVDIEAGDLAGDAVEPVACCAGIGELLAFDFLDGITNGFLVARNAQSGNDGGLQQLRIILEDNALKQRRPDGNADGLETETGELDFLPAAGLNGVYTIFVGDTAVPGGREYGNAGEGISVQVYDETRTGDQLTRLAALLLLGVLRRNGGGCQGRQR